MRLLVFIFSILISPCWGWSFANESHVAILKKQAKKRLLARKKGFEQHQKRQADYQKKRLARASKMKAIRKDYAAKKEKARRRFIRKKSPFPKAAYRTFLKKRAEHRRFLIKVRQDYSQVQDSIEAIYQNKKYHIDGQREYNLN